MSDLTLDDDHIYRWKGNPVPGVTEILTDVGIINGESMKFIDDSYRIRGVLVHEATAWEDEGDPAHTEDLEQNGIFGYCEAWKAYKAESELQFAEIERPYYQKMHSYAGTPDRLGWCKEGGPDSGVFDIKTGAPEKWHTIQLAAYSFFPPERLERGWCVYLHDDQTFTVKSHNGDAFKMAQRVWMAALTTYNFKHGRI